MGTAPHAAFFNRSRATFPWEGFRPSPEGAPTGPFAAGRLPCLLAPDFLAGADPADDGPVVSAAAPDDRCRCTSTEAAHLGRVTRARMDPDHEAARSGARYSGADSVSAADGGAQRKGPPADCQLRELGRAKAPVS